MSTIRCNSPPCTVKTFRQKSCNQSAVFYYVLLLGSRIYLDGSLDQRKVRWSGPVLWLGWLSSSSTATSQRYVQIQYNMAFNKSCNGRQIIDFL